MAIKIAAVTLIAACAVLAGCGSVGAHHHAAATGKVTQPPAVVAPVTQIPVSAPAPSQPAAEANWEQSSPGYQSWIDAGAAEDQVGQDSDAGNTLAMFGVGGDGFKLAEAASAALQNPSPVDRHAFKEAMANLGFMGVSLTNGNLTDAAKFAAKSLRYLDAWATVAQPGASGASGCGDWNLSAQSSNC